LTADPPPPPPPDEEPPLLADAAADATPYSCWVGGALGAIGVGVVVVL
jgi:hypothetical protein